MLRIKFTYFDLLTPSNPLNGDYYFASEALDYGNIYWEPRIVDPFDIERFFDVQSDTSNRIRTVSITLENSDGFLNQFMTKTTTFLNNFMTLYYDNGNGVTKTFTGRVQSIDSVSSSVRLTLREFGYEYLENTFPDAQIAYDYYSDSGINDSWNCIPIHFGTVKRIPLSWVNSFYSEFIIGSGPILAVDKVYIDDEVAYDATQPNKRYKPTDDSKEIYVRIFKGRGWDADGKRETVVDTYRPETLDPTRETVSGNNVTHISQWGGFAYIQLFSIDDNGYEIPAYPYNTDGALGQVYVDIRGIVRITKSGNTYTYTNTMVRNPAEIIKLMFCQPELVSEGPCAIGWGYKETDVNFSQAITDCNNLGFVVDGSFDTSGQFVESLKVILQCCRGYIVEEGEKITLKIDKLKDVNTPAAQFDEEGIVGFDCNLEEWNEPDLDSQTNRIRLNYDWSQEFKRYNKKPDVNHESPDYKIDNDYDEWLIDADHNKKVQKWNTEELELKMISDTTTAHKLAIYYLRKKCLQHIQGTLSCANSAAMNLDAGDLIGVKSKQFNWYKNDTGGTDPNKGKVFQITSIKKGDELTDIDFVEYDPAVFIADSRTFNLKERPDKIANLVKPTKPTSLTLTATSKEYAGTTICEINGTVVYASNSNKLFATVRYFDYGTSTPANDYIPPVDANWITYGNIDSNKFTISGLTPGHWYFIQVYTVNANGSSEPIVNKVKSLGDIIPPGIPTVSHTFTSGRSIGVKIELLNPPTDFRGFMLFKDGTYLTSITTNIHQNKATCEYTDVCEKYKTTYKYKATSYDKWNNISQYSTEIDITTPEDIDLDDITGTIEILQDDIADTNTRIDEYVSDDVLSVGEKSRLAEDWIAIRDSRYNKVKTEAENHYFHANFSVYNQDYLDFVDAYEELEAYVDGNGSTINLTPTPPAVLTESRIEGVGSTIKKKFSDYYDLEIKVLSDIDKDNKNRASTIYAECHTEANVASKWVILPDVVIFTGLRLCVKFFNGNTSPGVITLNIKRNISDESGLITGGKLYHNSGFAIPVITFEAGTTITLVLVERVENNTTVQAWEFSDSSILGLGEKELSLGNKTYNLGMVNGNRIIAQTVDTEQLNAGAVTTEKLTSEQIIGKDFTTAENVGEIDDETHEHISGVRFNANGIKAYNANGETVSIGINGDITAISGFIGGWKINSTSISSTPTSSSMPSIVLNANGMIYSSNYVNGVEGWRIDSIGNAEFNSAIIRGKIQSAVFEYDKVSAIGGKMMVKPASVIFADSTHVNTITTVYVKDIGSFAVGDCFYIKQDIEHMFYGLISAISTQTLSDGTVIGVITYSIPIEGGTFFEPDDGQSIINYGNPMSGGIMFDGRDGYIDIFKNHTVSLERDYNIYDPILNINAWDSTTASIAEEDGVVDISGEDNNGQAFGGVTVVKDKVMGRCFYFDGTDDYIILPAVDISSGTFTVSLTFKNTDFSSIPIILDMRTDTNQYANIMVGAYSNTMPNKLRVVTYIDSSTSNTYTTTSDVFHQNIEDICITLVFTEGTNLKIYINDVLDSSHTIVGNFVSTNQITLGHAYTHNMRRGLIGCIKDFRIFDKALTPEEVQVIYKQSLVTPYINSNMYEPILNLDADYSTTDSIALADGVIDVSGNHNNGQAYGGVSVVQDSEMGDCFSFDGVDDYLELKELNIENTAITISVNVYFNGFQENYNRMVDKRKSNNEWSLLYYPSTSTIESRKSSIAFESWNTDGTLTTYITDQNINIELNTWNNIVVTIDNVSKVLNIYLDGNLQKSHSFTDIKKINYINTNLVRIGTYALASGQFLNGLISDVRIYTRALSATEVYNVYQQSLNPEAFENPEKLISYDEINVHHFSGDAIQLDHLVRLGNLKGIGDITDDRYGIFLGDERSYLKYDSVDGLKLINSNFALDGSILSDNFLWIDGNGNAHDDINMEIASDIEKGITSGQRYTEIGSMINMTTGAFVTPTFRTMSAIGNNPAETHITGNMYFDNDTSGVIEPTTDNIITFGSSSKRWKGIYSKEGNFSYGLRIEGDNASSYCNGIRIKPVNNWSGILFGGNDLTSDVGTSGHSWFVGNNNGVFGFYKNGASTSASQYLQITSDRRLLSNLMIQLGGMEKLHPKTVFQLDVSYQKSTSAAVGTKVYALSNVLSSGYLEFDVEGAAMNLNSWTANISGQHFATTSSNRLACSTSVTISNTFTFMCEIDTATWTNNPSLIVALTSTSNNNNAFRINVNTSRQVELVIYNSSGTATTYTFTNCVCVNNSSSRIGVSVNNTSATCMVNGVWETKTITARTSSTITRFALGNYSASYGAYCGHMAFPTLINKALSIQEMYNLLENFVLFNSNMATYSHSATTAGTCTGNANTATTATNANNVQISKITDSDEHPFLFGTSFTNSTTNQAIHHACPSTTGSQCAFRGRMQLSAAGTQGRATLILGNSLATASANNARGELFLYGTGTAYLRFMAGDVTASRAITLVNGSADVTLTLPSATGTLALTSSSITGNAATSTKTAVTVATGGTHYGIATVPYGATSGTAYGITRLQTANNRNDAGLFFDANATSGNQRVVLILGNQTANTTAAGKNGQLQLYGTGTGMTMVIPGNNTANNINVYLPSVGGYIPVSSDNTVRNIQKVSSLPSSPDANTLYLIS